MDLHAEPFDLTLRTPFTISRGTQLHARNVLVEVRSGDLMGIGEAAPSAYYGERRETVLAALPYLAEQLGGDPMLREEIVARMDEALHHGNAAAKVAVEMALYDLAGKQLGVPVFRMLGLDPARTPVTSFTIAIDTPEAMAERAREAAREYPILKIKLGTPHDIEIVRAIREATNATLRVDANAAWTAKQAIQTIERLAEYDVEFVEQPVAASDLEGLKLVREHAALPIFADESCVTVEDVSRVVGRVDGINIKLMKCGGLGNAIKMIHVARAHHLKVMLGCMIESSLAITAAAQISPLVDYADLDGALLTSDDPFEGVRVEHGKLVLPAEAGLGVRRRETSAA